jgi:hypothetical protein
MTTTTNFGEFGPREIELAEELLRGARLEGFPNDFEQDEITIMMNKNSGYVFFINSASQVAMMNGDSLESFYTSPYKGIEGFYDELEDQQEDMHEEDKAWFLELGLIVGKYQVVGA